MVESFLIVGTQVLILCILIGLGFFGAKIKLITEDGVKSINNIMLYFVTPCVIVNAFQTPFDSRMLINLLLAMLASLISHLLGYLLGFIFIRDKDISRRRVLRFAAVFSNCGFMALPLVEALLGSEGVFYASGYLAVFNLMVWSTGQYLMAKGQANFSMKKSFLNPGVISVLIGLILFFTSCELPEIIGSPIAFLAGLNTPVPMLIIGYTISTIKLSELFEIKKEIITLLVRLVITPGILLVILYLAGYRGNLLTSVICSASTPVAAITTMFAIKYNQDEKLGSKLVAVSTLFSLITMTLIVGISYGIV